MVEASPVYSHRDFVADIVIRFSVCKKPRPSPFKGAWGRFEALEVPWGTNEKDAPVAAFCFKANPSERHWDRDFSNSVWKLPGLFARRLWYSTGIPATMRLGAPS